LVLLVVTKLSAQTTITLSADQDAALGIHYNLNTGDDNYGTAAQAAAFAINGNSGLNLNRAILSFDLSAIPQGAIITSAKLNLYANTNVGSLTGHSGANNAYLQRVTTAWSDNSVTWNNVPATTTQNQVTLPASTSNNQDYLNIDVLDLVNDMNTNGNYGFLLKLVNETPTAALLFCSNEYTDTNKHPKLVITYSQQCTDTAADRDAALGIHYNLNTGDDNYYTAAQAAAFAVNGNSGLNLNRAIFGFDLSTIPQNAIITSAKLNLYANTSVGSLTGHSGANSAYLQRVTAQWNESTVTWNNVPATTTTNQITLPASTTYDQDYLNIDVQALVADMVANGNYGFLLKLVNETPSAALLFCSINHANPDKHPTLEVCYNIGTNLVTQSFGQQNISIFPNPSQGVVNVNITKGDNVIRTIEVYNINGALIKSTTTKLLNNIIDLSGNSAGLYLVKVISNNNVYTQKVIVQ